MADDPDRHTTAGVAPEPPVTSRNQGLRLLRGGVTQTDQRKECRPPEPSAKPQELRDLETMAYLVQASPLIVPEAKGRLLERLSGWFRAAVASQSGGAA